MGVTCSILPVALAVGLLVGGCSTGGHVDLPAPNASPQEVVRTYTDALHVGDRETVAALRIDRGSGWCGTIDVTGLTFGKTDRTAAAVARRPTSRP